MSYMKHLV